MKDFFGCVVVTVFGVLIAAVVSGPEQSYADYQRQYQRTTLPEECRGNTRKENGFRREWLGKECPDRNTVRE